MQILWKDKDITAWVLGYFAISGFGDFVNGFLLLANDIFTIIKWVVE